MQALLDSIAGTPMPDVNVPHMPWPHDDQRRLRLRFATDDRPDEMTRTFTSDMPDDRAVVLWRSIVKELANEHASCSRVGRSSGRVFLGPKDRFIFWPRLLNSMLLHIPSATGRIFDLFTVLAAAGVKLDVKAAYRALELTPEDAAYHAAIVDGIWIVFNRLSFGMAQSPAAFASTIAVTIERLRGALPATEAALAQFVDDSGVSGTSTLATVNAAEQLVRALLQDGWWISLKKSFLLPAVRLLYIGFIADFGDQTVAIDPAKSRKALAHLSAVTRPTDDAIAEATASARRTVASSSARAATTPPIAAAPLAARPAAPPAPTTTAAAPLAARPAAPLAPTATAAAPLAARPAAPLAPTATAAAPTAARPAAPPTSTPPVDGTPAPHPAVPRHRWFDPKWRLPDGTVPDQQPLPSAADLVFPAPSGARCTLNHREWFAIRKVVGYLSWFQVALDFLGPIRAGLQELLNTATWTPDTAVAFDDAFALLHVIHTWKRRVRHPPGDPLRVVCDASSTGWGAVISLPGKDVVHLAGVFGDLTAASSSTTREAIAAVSAVSAAIAMGWRFPRVEVVVDSTALVGATGGRVRSPTVARAIVPLVAWAAQGLNISFSWWSRDEAGHQVPDALSSAARRPVPWPLSVAEKAVLWRQVQGWDVDVCASSHEFATVPRYATPQLNSSSFRTRQSIVAGIIAPSDLGWRGTSATVALRPTETAFAHPLWSELGSFASLIDPSRGFPYPLTLIAPTSSTSWWRPHLDAIRRAAWTSWPLPPAATEPPNPRTPRDPVPLSVYRLGPVPDAARPSPPPPIATWTANHLAYRAAFGTPANASAARTGHPPGDGPRHGQTAHPSSAFLRPSASAPAAASAATARAPPSTAPAAAFLAPRARASGLPAPSPTSAPPDRASTAAPATTPRPPRRSPLSSPSVAPPVALTAASGPPSAVLHPASAFVVPRAPSRASHAASPAAPRAPTESPHSDRPARGRPSQRGAPPPASAVIPPSAAFIPSGVACHPHATTGADAAARHPSCHPPVAAPAAPQLNLTGPLCCHGTCVAPADPLGRCRMCPSHCADDACPSAAHLTARMRRIMPRGRRLDAPAPAGTPSAAAAFGVHRAGTAGHAHSTAATRAAATAAGTATGCSDTAASTGAATGTAADRTVAALAAVSAAPAAGAPARGSTSTALTVDGAFLAALRAHGGLDPIPGSAPSAAAAAHGPAVRSAAGLQARRAVLGSSAPVRALELCRRFAAHRRVGDHPWSLEQLEHFTIDFLTQRLDRAYMPDIPGWAKISAPAALCEASRIAAALRRANIGTIPAHCGSAVKAFCVARGAKDVPEHSAAYPLHLTLLLEAEPPPTAPNRQAWEALVLMSAFALRTGIVYHVWSDMFIPYDGGYMFVWRHTHKRTASIADINDLDSLSKIGSITGARLPALHAIINRDRPNHLLFPGLTADHLTLFVRAHVRGSHPGFDIRTYGTRTSADHDGNALWLPDGVANRIFWWKPKVPQMRAYYASQAICESFTFTERRAGLRFHHFLPGSCDLRIPSAELRDWRGVGVGPDLPDPPPISAIKDALNCYAPSVGLTRNLRADTRAKRARRAAGEPSTSSESGSAPVCSGPCTKCSRPIDTDDDAAACVRCTRIVCLDCWPNVETDWRCPVHQPPRKGRRVARAPAPPLAAITAACPNHARFEVAPPRRAPWASKHAPCDSLGIVTARLAHACALTPSQPRPLCTLAPIAGICSSTAAISRYHPRRSAPVP